VLKALRQFEEATTFGSLIQPVLGEHDIQQLRQTIEAKDLGGQLFLRETHAKVLRVLEQAEALTQRYHLVVTNPPYMGGKGMNSAVKAFLSDYFENYTSDLFAAFVVRIIDTLRPSGFGGLMTPFTWMFIKSYEPLRKKLLAECSIRSLIRPEYHSFFDSAYVPICAFLIQTQVDVCVELARTDWDNFETSWDFHDHPLLRLGTKNATLEESWEAWRDQCAASLRRMQELETENNRLFITAYGLQDELQPEVAEDQITLARADARRDMVAFLSYSVGCMMGRYSLDKSGLLLADAGDSLREFLEKVGKPLDALTFTPNDDGILPMLDGDWFEGDVVGRVREFLRVTFGPQALEQNVAFVEDALGKDLRKYFLTDFYKDHLQTYKKRPIYWLFQSPQKHFRALVYLHRYTRDTANTLLNGYLREFHHKLNARISDRQHILDSESASARDKTRAQKDFDKAKKARADVELYEREILLPLAQKRLEIDLDDGVKANYPKFGPALASIPGMTDEED
jgi:N-6 DNA Methylase